MNQCKTQVFFQSLLKLCKSHSVNIEEAKITFHIDETFDNDIHFNYVEVTGGWDIREDSAALTANRVIRPALTDELTINGYGTSKENDEDDCAF